MQVTTLKKYIIEDKLDDQFKLISCLEDISAIKRRYLALVEGAFNLFGDQDYHIFSTPGRTEVGGNHTDHQHGKVLAASVNMDVACVVYKCDDVVRFVSEGYDIEPILLNDLSIHEDEYNSSESLIRGVLARFKELGYNIGGFKCFSNSAILKGSGISSSAAFEVMIGTILSKLYNDGKVSSVEIAKISQYAENNYFNKPCGLMDQMACSVGGFISIDFKDVNNPIIEQIDFDFIKSGYHLCLIDTKGDHADLSDEYSSMPQEMISVARVLGKEVLSETTMEELLNNIALVRSKCSDRAILRAIHFFNEDARVLKEVAALKNNDFNNFKDLVIESGYSSYMYLQNIYSPSNVLSQNISIALAISEQFLKGKGAYRVHGGGLAGTIQAFVPKELLSEYRAMMEKIYGQDSCFVLAIRSVGGHQLI